jgi:hypothetical protein
MFRDGRFLGLAPIPILFSRVNVDRVFLKRTLVERDYAGYLWHMRWFRPDQRFPALHRNALPHVRMVAWTQGFPTSWLFAGARSGGRAETLRRARVIPQWSAAH